jgi:hypothetical protein
MSVGSAALHVENRIALPIFTSHGAGLPISIAKVSLTRRNSVGFSRLADAGTSALELLTVSIAVCLNAGIAVFTHILLPELHEEPRT